MFTNKPWARSFANPSPGTACSSRPDHVQEAFPFKLVWFLKPEFFHLSFVLNAWWIWLTPGTLFTFSSASINGCTRSRESKWYFTEKNFAKQKVTDLGGTPLPPFTDIPPKNVLQKVLKMVFFAQKTPVFGPKNRLRIWGVPPSPPLRTKFSAKRELRIWGVPPPPPLWTKSTK